ncbi:MAG TPA: TolC family protein, partial [Sulfuricurvum sp.]|nr:TolC family protein [Sulfuricurvum sp.]
VATRKTVALFEERYKQGLSTYIDVLESQNTLDNAYTSLAEAKYQKIRAYALMQKLLNQGCDNDVCK